MNTIIAQEPVIDSSAVAGAARPGIIADIAILTPERWATGDFWIMTLAIPNDVRCVVRDDVHIDLQPARMGSIHESFEVLTRTDMRIDIGKIRNPIAMIPR